MKRKFLSLLLALCMVAALLPVTAQATTSVWDGTAAASFAGGSGTEGDPYLIADAAQLALMADKVNNHNSETVGSLTYGSAYYKLTAGIMLNDVSNYENWGTAAPANTWTPIASGNTFAGGFDGDGHTLSGLYINADSLSLGQGLFGYIAAGGVVENIALVSGYVSSRGDAGGIAGRNLGTIRNCGNSMTVISSYISRSAGGITAVNHGGTLSNCYNTGAVTASGDSGNAGGIAGYNYSGTASIENCYSADVVTASGSNGKAGGIAGYNSQNVRNCYWLSGGPTDAVGNINGSATDCSSFGTDQSLTESVTIGGSSRTTLVAALNAWADADAACHDWVDGSNGANGGYPLLGNISSYSVTYNANGGAGNAPIQSDLMQGAIFSAAANSFTPPAGKRFKEWNTAAKGSGTSYATGATVTMPENALILYAIWKNIPYDTGGSGGGSYSPSWTITVTETSSKLFIGSAGQVRATADMASAFSNSIEVKVSDTSEDASSFGFSAGSQVYPFDISLYIKGANTKTQPRDGCAVTISLPVPDELLDVKEQISVVHKSDNGVVTTLESRLEQINDVWYLVFKAAEFSPYALVVNNTVSFNEPDLPAGVPYYLDADGNKVFIGFAANGKYIAPAGAAVQFMENAKSYADVSGHWAMDYIGFVTEREIFAGTGTDTFSPDTGMTRAMFAAVAGRLYERSYGEIEAAGARAFTDCDYDDYYGKYVDWCAENAILEGVGGGLFEPGREITREEMAAILYRFAGFLGVLPEDSEAALNYPDSDSISSWAADAALYCQTTGIISGRGGAFAPQATASRAEVATIVQQFVKLVIE